ncbi:MAG: septation protein A [Hyphomicrobiales bacterium]|nr:MAG: septation protein A [Hyphomicrobiales bacterium]
MTADQKKPDAAAGKSNSIVKLLVELGPLVAFFAAYGRAGIYWATGILMIATVVALIASWRMLGRISPVPVITAVLVVVFGGLTFLLDDPSFIKMKPTMINLIFAGALIVGAAIGKSPLKLMLGEAFRLKPEGWRILSYRWAAFFFVLAVANEYVWRNFSEATWVNFKVFGILPLTFLFAMTQIGVIRKYESTDDPA